MYKHYPAAKSIPVCRDFEKSALIISTCQENRLKVDTVGKKEDLADQDWHVHVSSLMDQGHGSNLPTKKDIMGTLSSYFYQVAKRLKI